MQLCISILSYNHPDLTEKSVRSALASGLPVQLVHNGSKEENVVRLRAQFPNVQHVVLSQNLGFSGGANACLTHALRDFEFCFFITNDCTVRNLNLASVVRGITIPKIFVRTTDRIHSFGGRFWPDLAKLEHCSSAEDFMNIPSGARAYVPASAFLIDRESFFKIGLFDENLGTYWEDVDWSVRAQKARVPLRLCAEIQLSHGVGKTCHRDTRYTIYYFHRNAKRVSWRYSKNRTKLAFFLTTQYLNRGMNLIARRRWNDLGLLVRAGLDLHV